MGWSNEQRTRLAFEKALLDDPSKGFSAFKWVNPGGGGATYLVGQLTTNSRNTFAVKVLVPTDFPASPPQGWVAYPCPLRDYYGSDLTDCSAKMHTLSAGADGCTQICLFRSESWSPQNTLWKVILKIRLWLEAYDAHKRTGESIDTYLKHQ